MLYEVFAGYTAGAICEAVFFERDAALAFINAENDKVECELYWIEEWHLIDDYGCPFNRRDLSVIWPNHFEIPAWAMDPA